KCSITMTVDPRRSAADTLACGAEGYSGAGLRYVMPARNPNMAFTNSITGHGSSGPADGSSRRMPLGWPVVPDEYSMAAPSDSPGTGSAEHPATTSSYDSQPTGSGVDPVISMRSRSGH